MKYIIAVTLALYSLYTNAAQVSIMTNLGNIEVELYDQAAPLTVKNFLSYVDAGFYKETIFHRVIPGFMAQGGGFTKDMERKDTRKPIPYRNNFV